MARPAKLPYHVGAISYTDHPTREGYLQARATYVDGNGRRRDVSAMGKTQAAAKRALEAKVEDARTAYQGGDSTLNSKTTTANAAKVWLAWKLRQQTSGKPLAKSTVYTYTSGVDLYVASSSLAKLPIATANDVSRIESWLAEIADTRGEGAARHARKVLGGVLQLAERRGAIPASVMHRVVMPSPAKDSTGDRKCKNADCDYECGKRHLNTRRAFTSSEVADVMEHATASKADIADLSAFLFATGCRLAEALHHVAWADVDLEAKTVRVRGTKTEAADRILPLSDELAERLQAGADNYGTKGLVFGVTRFASKAGEPRDPVNVAKALRRTFKLAGVQWAGTHTFRRTVATWMDESGASLAEIANQLGHSDTNVTAGYLGRTAAPTRAATVMILPKADGKKHLRAV